MPLGHSSTPDQAPHNRVSAATANQLYEALEPVQQALRQRHIPCLRVALISLELREQQPNRSFPQYHMPALEIWNRLGKIVAAVTVSVDLSHFQVTVPSQQDEPYIVATQTPELVAAFIPGYGREMS